MKTYMTHNGPKTMLEMRYELYEAGGDIHWGNPFFLDKSDRRVIEEYARIGKPGGKAGYVVEM